MGKTTMECGETKKPAGADAETKGTWTPELKPHEGGWSLFNKSQTNEISREENSGMFGTTFGGHASDKHQYARYLIRPGEDYSPFRDAVYSDFTDEKDLEFLLKYDDKLGFPYTKAAGINCGNPDTQYARLNVGTHVSTTEGEVVQVDQQRQRIPVDKIIVNFSK